jgi:hypothetical protein
LIPNCLRKVATHEVCPIVPNGNTEHDYGLLVVRPTQ